MHSFSSRLIAWQRTHGRHDLPWQGANAYQVWLSEIMLQQTQVATVIPYYQRFVASFPTIVALAAANEEQVLTRWSGLGYYARGRNLHEAARIVVEQYGGEFPRQFEQILELPGIGRSTAAAICALAYHERRAILDGNVKRVLARYCGISGSPSEKAVEAQLWQQAEALLPQSPRPAGERVRERGEKNVIAAYIQAQMDLGATLCTRSKPKCVDCPVRSDCVALQSGRVSELPTPRPRKTVPERHTTFLLLMHGNDILLEKRPGSGIWGGLWCLPQVDDEAAVFAWCAQQGVEIGKKVRHSRGGGNPVNSKNQCEALTPFTHTFTHFKLHITPVLLRVASKPQPVQQAGSVWLDVEEALRAGIPTPVRALLNKLRRG
jgi:A/G-specific adenine glycosylase